MNRLLRFLTIALLSVLPMAGCDSGVENTALPTVKIVAGEATSTTVSFRVTATNAAECAYILYEEGSLTAELVLSEGVKIAGNGTLTTVEGLTPDTSYIVVAAARNSRGTALAPVVPITTLKGDATPEVPDYPQDPDARQLEIDKTTDGYWYADTNYYVTLVATTGEQIILDFYTLNETLSSYLPYGTYFVNDTQREYTICSESSLIILEPEHSADDGYFFTDGSVNVSVMNGYYAIYFHLTYEVDGTANIIEGFFNGLMSGAAVPEGDNEGAKRLIEVHEVGSSSFTFTIHAEEGEYWRCSVVDRRVYDQYQSNPGAWVVAYGFMLDGTRTFNWEDGKECEHVPGYMMDVTPSTDYLILAALMDYSEGQENNLRGGVEVVQIHTEAEAAGTGTVEINIKEINSNDIVFDCTFGDDVWCCYVAIIESDSLQEIKDGKYAMAGYDSYEECMLSLITGLSHDSMRQFIEPQTDYRWDYLKYNTSYTMCIKVVDMDNGVSFIELEPFTTK